ncbi:MAG: SMP-30/gluconolactonase/LRE family protein, partial [Chthoniobacteraceae bacterium]
MKHFSAECVHRAEAVLGEGPAWDEAGQCLWWVDIERCAVHRFNPAAGEDCSWTLPHRVGFAIPTERGDLVVGTQSGLGRFDAQSGAFAPVADPESSLPFNRFNDAKCDAAGRLWAGTMAVSEAPGLGSLYCIDASWIITRHIERVSISNGLAWSPDGRTLYYIDSPTRRVEAFDFEMKSGALSNRRTVIEIADAFPDGMCIDADGNLWIALWGGWAVACFDPRTGRQLAKVELPVRDVTSCCFGGGACTDLYMTTATRDLDTAGRKEQPLAGGIFRARPGVSGMPTRCFAG